MLRQRHRALFLCGKLVKKRGATDEIPLFYLPSLALVRPCPDLGRGLSVYRK